MRNRTRVVAAAAAVTAALAGSTAAALASTSGATPGTKTTTTTASVSGGPASAKCPAGTDIAARLGVTPGRLDQALRSVKSGLVHETGGTVTQSQFDAAVARNLSVSSVKVQQAFAAGDPGCAKPGGSAPGGSKPAPSRASEQQAQAAITAVVARELHVTRAQASAALRSIFAAGHADPQSASFAAAARSLGVSTQQLNNALMHAKESQQPAGSPSGSK
jgi:hypothetical protein